MTATDKDTGKSINACANIQPGSEPNGTKEPFKVEYTLVYFNLVQICFADNSFNQHSLLLYVKTSKHQRLFRFLNQSRCASVLNKATFVPAIVRNVGKAGAVMFMVPDLYASFYEYYASKINARFPIPVLFINEYHSSRLVEFSKLNNKTLITVERPPNPFVNGGFVLIIIMTSLCVFLGSVWSALTHQKLYLLEYTRIKLKIEYSGTHHYDQKKLSDNKKFEGNATNGPTTSIKTDDESGTETTVTANRPSLAKKNTSFADAKSSHDTTKKSRLSRSNTKSVVKSSRTIDDWYEPPVRMLNWFIVLTLFSFVVGTLLLMYFFFLYMLRFITVFYCFGATIAICFCFLCLVDVIIGPSNPQFSSNFRRLAACLQRLWPSLCHGVACVLPMRIVFCYGLSVLLVLMWYIHRMHHYAFAVHNVISMCFCIFALRCIRLPSVKWITVVFSLFFFYDVFMVFLTPFFTKTGCAIMVDVATGGACSMDFPGPPSNDTDELPLLFRMPDFTNPLLDCFNLTMDLQYPPIMIGFGDVIIPGFLVSYNLAFDLSLGLWYKPYFVVSFVGYVVGLIVTFWILILSGMAQPALTYLVPLTLLPTFVVAVVRREFRTIWNGDFSPVISLSAGVCLILCQIGLNSNMSTVQGNYAKIAIIGSTVAYLSAGMALYYIYKRYRDRQRSKNRRKLSKTLSSASLHIKKEREGCDCKHCTGVEKILSCDLMQSCRRENDDQNDALECNVTQKVARNLQHENTENIKADPAAPEIITNASTFVSLKIDNSTGNVQNNNGKSHLSGIDCVDSQVCDVEVSSTMRQQDQHILGDDFSHNMIHSKNECVNSPSISSDGECSQDSGKGASMGLTTSTSPVNDLVGIELPPMYEFEVPQDIVGLIIGRKGATIKYFTEESGAHIVIRHHHFSDKHKICTIEGTREQINKCLRLIRYKFPPSRFPELKLTPLLPPPIVSPHSPVFDSIINLNLPEGVSCEVTLSSMVDASHFFVQQPTHPTFPSLARLDQYLLAVYSQPAGVPGLPKPIESGIICVAPVLGGWYRAQTVATFPETDEVLVRFVDYGGYSRISAADLRQIRSDFMNLPFQAIECILANVKPVDESEGWSAEANAFFEKCVHGKLSEAVLLAKEKDSLIPMVELYCSVDGKMEKISQLLVDNGYAALVDCSTESYADSLATCNF